MMAEDALRTIIAVEEMLNGFAPGSVRPEDKLVELNRQDADSARRVILLIEIAAGACGMEFDPLRLSGNTCRDMSKALLRKS